MEKLMNRVREASHFTNGILVTTLTQLPMNCSPFCFALYTWSAPWWLPRSTEMLPTQVLGHRMSLNRKKKKSIVRPLFHGHTRGNG